MELLLLEQNVVKAEKQNLIFLQRLANLSCSEKWDIGNLKLLKKHMDNLVLGHNMECREEPMR